MACCKVVAREHIDGAQNIKGTWHIYMKDINARVELLTKGISLRHKAIRLYDKNPVATNINTPEMKVEKNHN